MDFGMRRLHPIDYLVAPEQFCRRVIS
jgi:hypothetical protein